MRFLVRVRVNLETMGAFGQRLQRNELDRRLVKSETYCLAEDPAVGYSVWEARDRQEFDSVFSQWKAFYSETEISEVIDPSTAMRRLLQYRETRT